MTMTHTTRRTALICAVAIGALLALGAALPSRGTAQDSGAVAVNTHDESSIFRLAFTIRRVTGDVVDETNAAVAYASCEDCRTVAIAIQILLVQSDPAIVSPENLSLAINENCTMCDTFASAYQIVLGDGTRLRFTAAGAQAIAEIRRELQALRNQDLSDDELDSRLDAIYHRLKGVLDSELVGVGKPTQPAPDAPATQAAPDATTTQTTPAQTTPAEPEPAQTTPVQPPAETTPAQPPAETTPAPTPTTTTSAPTTTTP